MSLRESDEKRALSVLEDQSKKRKKVRQRRCMSCGYLYDLDELHPEHNEDGRPIGLICDSCI